MTENHGLSWTAFQTKLKILSWWEEQDGPETTKLDLLLSLQPLQHQQAVRSSVDKDQLRTPPWRWFRHVHPSMSLKEEVLNKGQFNQIKQKPSKKTGSWRSDVELHPWTFSKRSIDPLFILQTHFNLHEKKPMILEKSNFNTFKVQNRVFRGSSVLQRVFRYFLLMWKPWWWLVYRK